MTSFMFWNLHEAARGLRVGDDRQWQHQVAVVRRHRPDVLAVTEGWDWHLDDDLLFRRAITDFGYDHGELYEAKTSCDMAVMWRDGTTAVAVERQAHWEAWWHGFLRVSFRLPGTTELFVLMVSHLNPFDPTLRRIEGSCLRNRMLHTTRGVLVMDANTVPPDDDEPATCLTRSLPGELTADRTPLAGLAAIGLVDVGAAFQDRRPTHGHYDLGPQIPQVPLRLDQAWATPSVELTAYSVVDSTTDDPELDAASDHRPILFCVA